MNEIAFIVGVGLFLGFLLYIIFKLDTEHIYLKFLLFFVFISLVLLIPKSLMDNQNICEVKINETIYNGSTTTYDYDRFCFENPYNNGRIFFTQTMTIMGIVALYFLMYWFKKIFVRDKYI
jgi:hypothetical protein